MVSKNRIMVVEDDLNLNKLLCKKLSTAGYDVQGSTTVAETIAMLRHLHPPKVLILDLSLIDGKGTDVLDFMAKAGITGTRVIVLSGRAYERDYRLNGRDVDYTLLKPVSPRKLVALVHHIFDGEYTTPDSVML